MSQVKTTLELLDDALARLTFDLKRLDLKDLHILKNACEKYLNLIESDQRNFIRSVKCYGGELSPEERKLLGLKNNSIIGKSLANGFSKLIHIDDILMYICRYVSGFRAKEKILNEVNQFPFLLKVKISGVDDDRTCVAYHKIKKISFLPQECPVLPLKNCDALYCRCVYLYDSEDL